MVWGKESSARPKTMGRAVIDFLFGPNANPTVVAAIIAAITSIVVSLSAQFFNLFSGTRIEHLRSELLRQIEGTRAQLSELTASRNARRDYEYDARKRLYSEIEPLLFQLFEAVEQSYHRVRSLARTARSGSLNPGNKNWLGQQGYYLHSTMYYMILPAIIFRLIRNRMTFVDLDLDSNITTKYYLTKIYAFSFTDDFVLASAGRKLPYDPNNPNWNTLVEQDPARYHRQGLLVGDMEALLDQMPIEEDKTTRTITYAEFERLLAKDPVSKPLSELRKLFFSFNPSLKPVVARMLLVQACLSYLILDSYEVEDLPELRNSLDHFIESDEFGIAFAWEKEVDADDRAIVRDYVLERLSWIPDRERRAANLT
jgi:hypothetical protein